MRSKAHKSFDRIWQRRKMGRSQAYRWLARQLEVPEPEAHMGVITSIALLQRVIDVSDQYIGSTVLEDDFSDEPPSI